MVNCVRPLYLVVVAVSKQATDEATDPLNGAQSIISKPLGLCQCRVGS